MIAHTYRLRTSRAEQRQNTCQPCELRSAGQLCKIQMNANKCSDMKLYMIRNRQRKGLTAAN